MHGSTGGAAALIAPGYNDDPAITRTLERFGPDALALARIAGIRIVPLARGERYSERSSALQRLEIDVDAWPAPPAG